jgi:hypothetical protein
MRRAFVYILLIQMIIAYGCGQKKLPVEQPPPEEVKHIAPIGKKIAANLVTTLKSEVKSAMNEGGVEKAITVCNVKALPLSDSVAKSSSFNVDIKRVSYKVRNPKNKPDEFEALALDLYNEMHKNGEEIPEFYIQKITLGEKAEYNFYKPMYMENLCLICHGEDQVRAPSADRLIAQFYPEDEAKNYKEGDFRGLIRIKFYEPFGL